MIDFFGSECPVFRSLITEHMLSVLFIKPTYHILSKVRTYPSKQRLNGFLDRKSTKTINNLKIIGLNRMDRLKHRIEIFFGRSTQKISKICL